MTLSHRLLLNKLDLYGICGLSNNWFESYMSNRSIQVKCQTLSCNTTEFNKQYHIKYRTPQGSCLGPLLFNLFCNDLYMNIEYCNLIMFGDDTTLYASHRNVSYLNYILQKDLINLENWFAANSLSLNASKTFAMKCWQDSSMCKEKINLMLNQTTMPIVSHIKFLGVIIDSKLKWSEHINNIISKISINKNILGRT